MDGVVQGRMIRVVTGEVVVVEVSAVASGDPRGALGATRLVVGDTKILPKKFE